MSRTRFFRRQIQRYAYQRQLGLNNIGGGENQPAFFLHNLQGQLALVRYNPDRHSELQGELLEEDDNQ